MRRSMQLAFLQPIPRHMVHRAAVAEVFLTDAVTEGADRFLVAAQWPRDHALYHPDGNGRTDPLLLAETIRQSLVYLAHQYYDVPLTHRFIGRDMDFEITEPDLLKTGAAPLPVVLEVTWTWADHRPPQRFGMRIEAVLTVGGVPCGRGSLRVVAVDEKRYSLLRRRRTGAIRPAGGDRTEGSAPTERVPAHRVGRLRAKDSVLRSAGPAEWNLEIDLGHAILFDHPTDHIPLMVLLEGFRQLGYLQTRETTAVPHMLTGVSVDCRAFAELDAPVRLVMTEHRHTAQAGRSAEVLRVQAVQAGVLVSAATMSWTADLTADLTADRAADQAVDLPAAESTGEIALLTSPSVA